MAEIRAGHGGVIVVVVVVVQLLSHVSLFVIPWTVASQAPLSIGFPRQKKLEWIAIFFSRNGM